MNVASLDDGVTRSACNALRPNDDDTGV